MYCHQLSDGGDISSLPPDVRQHITQIEVQDLYLFMGRELEALEAVPAGNVLGTCTKVPGQLAIMLILHC